MQKNISLTDRVWQSLRQLGSSEPIPKGKTNFYDPKTSHAL